MENTLQPTLLSKARAFVLKSALVVIAPLALVQVAKATPLTVFGVSVASSGGSVSGFVSGGSFNETGYSGSQLPEFNFIEGAMISQSGTFTFAGSGDGTVSLNMGGASSSGTSLSSGAIIPTSYSFTLSQSDSFTVTSWTLNFGLGSSPDSVSGSGLGDFSGSLDLVVTAGLPSYWPTLVLNITGAASGDTLSVDMTGGKGIAYNVAPVPEPSTYALFFGMGALGFVVVRRRLRSVA